MCKVNLKFIVCFFFSPIINYLSTDHIRELRKELFKNRDYDPMARPVLNYTHPVNVSIYLDINYIKKIVRHFLYKILN